MDMVNHYRFGLGWIPGKDNGAADALSRKAELAPENPEEEKPAILFLKEKFFEIAAEIAQLTTEEYEEVVIAYIGQNIILDQQIQDKIRNILPTTELPATVVAYDGLAYHEEQVFILPNEEVKNLILQLCISRLTNCRTSGTTRDNG